MPQSHPTTAVAAAKLPKERLTQLDRVAARRQVSRSRLIRDAIQVLLDEANEPLTEGEEAELRQRALNEEAKRRLGEISERLRLPLADRLTPEALRSSMRL